MDSWINLNEDLLEEIVLRLGSFNDYLRLSLVCKVWQSILSKRLKNLPTTLPCLMLPYDKKDDTHCDFFSIFTGEGGKVYNLQVPEALNTLCIGSSKGWLVRLEDGPSIRLINPLTSIQFELPPIYTFPNVLEYCPERTGEEYTIQMAYYESYLNFPISLAKMKHKLIHKVVLSSSPITDNNCFAMAIYGDRFKLACCRLGDDRWKSIEGEWNPFEDVMHYDGKFYAVDYQGMVIVLPDEEIEAKSAPKAEHFARLPSEYKFSLHKLYLVISCDGELLIVDRDIEETQSKFYETVDFKIFKLNKNSETKSRWCEVETLGEQVLFLGINESFSISSHHLVQCSRKGNCIYFTDDDYESQDHLRQNVAGSDLGVFYLNREKTRFQTLPLPLQGYNGRRKRIWPPPIWLMPNPIVTTNP
ncbi:hypothetical protein FRX31_023806 [Thalictrum thalictroides]|uniref:F-box domain-containing protein n=1 Tax=Thalictrum thalictroides TaxID=46969 RepID=A0A7J6VPW7_THATH|nr:hypothetical protein FRX31_023806 [Thalictrum thalictroides]